MSSRWGRRIATALLAFVVVLAVAAAALAWRLSQGPIPLPPLTQHFERGLSALSPDLVAHVAQTELAWAGDLPELRVVDVKIARRDGSPIVSLPALSVRPSLRALAHGELAVRRLGVSGVHLTLVRDEQGRMLLGSPGATSDADEPSIDFGGLLTTEGQGGSAAGYLKRVVVRQASVAVDDRMAASKWKIENADLEMVRRRDTFDIDVAGNVSLASPTGAAIHGAAAGVVGKVRIPRGAEPQAAGADFALESSNGRIMPAGDPGPPLVLRTLVAEGRFVAVERRLFVTKLRGSIGSAELDGAGAISLGEGGTGLEVHGEIRSLPVVELRRLWPTAAAAPARDWVVKNIAEGVVTRCRYAIRLPPAGSPPQPLPANAVDVNFDFDRLSVHYFGEFDPVRDVRGSGKITVDGFSARVTQGTVGGNLRVSDGKVDIKFHGTPAELLAAADVAGPSAEIYDELGRAPLDLHHKVGLPESGLSGEATAHVDVFVPLRAGLESKDVKVSGRAEITDASFANLIAGIGIDKGKLAVRVEGRKVDIEGDTSLSGLPGVTEPTHLTVGFAPGEQGSELNVALDGKDLVGEANARFAEGSLRTVSVPRARFAGNDLAVDLSKRPDGGYHLSIAGEKLDLEPWLKGENSGGDLAKKVSGSYDGEFRLKKIALGKGIEIQDVNGNGRGQGVRIDALDATGSVSGAGPLRANIAQRRGATRLRVTSAEAGRLLKAFGMFADADGGKLILIARFGDKAAKQPTEGRLDVHDFRVTRAPVLARVLSAGSLTGFSDLLEGEGITFTRLRVPFRWSEGKVEVHDASAVGAMGITAEGVVDRRSRHIDLRGRVIPAYTLNSALGKIPYVGKFLVGGSGEGVFGIDYRVSGGLDHPDVSVNPLSALAPGVLRKMFIDPFTQRDEESTEETGDATEEKGDAAPPSP